MSERWSIYIDIQGFSSLWKKDNTALSSLGELMRAIFRIARNCYPREPERLFAHQFGDGFLILSDFNEKSLERCATIAIVLMRHVAASGCMTRASIAEGEFSDIFNCYPKEVLDAIEHTHRVSLHTGLMTIVPVMGTALINAISVDKDAPRGPLLTIHSSKAERLGPNLKCVTAPNPDITTIDWVHAYSDLLTHIQQKAGLLSPTSEELEGIVTEYCRKHEMCERWRESLKDFLGVSI